MEARTFGRKEALQGARAHPQAAGNTIHRRLTVSQRTSNQMNHMSGQFILIQIVKTLNFLLHKASQFRVGSAQWMLQPMTRKNQCVIDVVELGYHT
jgi:hypothetical protein